MDCFVAEPVIRPAKGGTGWLLAMTPENAYTFSTPHHSAMNNAVALVDFFNDSRSTYSLNPCISAPVAPKQRLGMS